MLGVFLIGNFSLISLTNTNILRMSCPGNQTWSCGFLFSSTICLACHVIVDPCWLLVAFLQHHESAFVNPRCLGISVCSCRSASVTGWLPPAPCVCLFQPDVPAAFLFPGLALLYAKPDRVCNLSCPRSPWLLTCQCNWGAWSCDDWAFDQQVHTLCASLESNSGTDAWRPGEYLIEILVTY